MSACLIASFPADVAPLDLDAIRHRVDRILMTFLADKACTTASYLPPEIPQTLSGFLAAGGKRIRPLLCVIGWYAAGGSGPLDPVLRMAASLEMFHAFALIHDDLIDHSDTRRGQPTVHRTLCSHYHPTHGPAAEDLGANAALLIGNLALSWSDELVHTAGLAPAQLAAVFPLIDAMRTEVMAGQYLDIVTSGCPTRDIELALTIVRYKTAKYTIERPLHIGAALAGADDRIQVALSAYALPVGDAFQLRDDLQGVFGDSAVIGKSCVDDLREGKHGLGRCGVGPLQPLSGCSAEVPSSVRQI